MDDLINSIDSLRENLNTLILKKKLTDIEVIFCSQALDELLVQYMKRNLIRR